MTKRIWILAFLLCTQTVWAAGATSAGRNSIGALLGAGFVDTSSNALTWGIDARFALTDNIPIGIYYMTYGGSIELTNTDLDFKSKVSSTARHFGTMAGYKIGFIPGAEIGFRAAYVRSENKTHFESGGATLIDHSTSDSNFAVAPRFALEFVSGKISFGAEFNYFFGLGQNAPNGVFLLAPIRYYYY